MLALGVLMPNYTTSTNMGLTLPNVGQETGPQYASEINGDLTLIDQHDHSFGKGVQITPAGMNISSDLSFLSNNATALRTTRFTSQSTPITGTSPDLSCVYVTNGDLYYNDSSGNQVRITQSGGVAGSPGSITGLVAPASATYVSVNSTFVWQSGASIAANLDARSVILRNSGASSFGLTLSPPSGMGSDSTITLPSLPASQSIVTLDNTGAFAVPGVYPIISSSIAAGAVTRPKMVAVGQVISSAGGSFTTTQTADVLLLQTTPVTTTGRPVMVFLQPSVTGAASYLEVNTTGGNNALITSLARTAGSGSAVTTLGQYQLSCNNPVTTNLAPCGSIQILDTPSAGTYNYQCYVRSNLGSQSAGATNVRLVAYEL